MGKNKNQNKRNIYKQLPADPKKKNPLIPYKILFFLSSALLFSLFIYAVYDGKFFPTSEDETIYYNAARLFQQTNSIQHTDCVSEEVSIIGRCNWYGPFYNIFYGVLAKIFGYDSIQFVVIHFLLIAGCLLLIFKLPTEILIKWKIALCFLTAEVAYVFIFTYYPETLHVFSGVLLTFVLIQMYRNNKPYVKYCFILLVLFFTFARITTIFWLIGLLPFSKSKTGYIINALIFLSGVFLTMVFQKYFLAPAWAVGIKSIDNLYKLEIIRFINIAFRQFFINCKGLFQWHNLFAVFLFGLTFVRTIIHKNKLLTATGLISFTLFMVLLVLYDTNPLFFIKQIAFLIPLMIIVNFMTIPTRSYLIILFALLFFPLTVYMSYRKIKDSKSSFSGKESNKEFISSLANIIQYMEPYKKNTVLWCYNEYNYPGPVEALIPLSTSQGKPILFTTNITAPDAPSKEKFQFFHKLKVDYLLSRFPVTQPDLKLLYYNSFFYFYSYTDAK